MSDPVEMQRLDWLRCMLTYNSPSTVCHISSLFFFFLSQVLSGLSHFPIPCFCVGLHSKQELGDLIVRMLLWIKQTVNINKSLFCVTTLNVTVVYAYLFVKFHMLSLEVNQQVNLMKTWWKSNHHVSCSMGHVSIQNLKKSNFAQRKCDTSAVEWKGTSITKQCYIQRAKNAHTQMEKDWNIKI